MKEHELRAERESLLAKLPGLKDQEERAAQAELRTRARVDEIDWTNSRQERPVADISQALQRWEEARKALGQAQVELGACHRRLAAIAWHLRELAA